MHKEKRSARNDTGDKAALVMNDFDALNSMLMKFFVKMTIAWSSVLLMSTVIDSLR